MAQTLCLFNGNLQVDMMKVAAIYRNDAQHSIDLVMDGGNTLTVACRQRDIKAAFKKVSDARKRAWASATKHASAAKAPAPKNGGARRQPSATVDNDGTIAVKLEKNPAIKPENDDDDDDDDFFQSLSTSAGWDNALVSSTTGSRPVARALPVKTTAKPVRKMTPASAIAKKRRFALPQTMLK